MTVNSNLHAAKRAKNDEFYTRLEDVENELRHYRKHFRGKVVYCNCDDPYVSAFFEYFTKNFEFLGLKKLITTCYKSDRMDLFSRNDAEHAIKLVYEGGAPNSLPSPDDIGVTRLNGDGDFRSAECVELLRESDIVVTNPPFSMFREYLAQLMENDKLFLVIGNQNMVTYKEVFTMIQANRLWLGNYAGDLEFVVPPETPPRATRFRVGEDGTKYRSIGTGCWFTNLDHFKRHEELILVQRYHGDEESYPRYGNYDAIEVNRTKNIPVDYEEAMGVPITFLDKYNPDQFEILGITDRGNQYGLKTKVYDRDEAPNASDLNRRAAIKVGKNKYRSTYARILIRRR